MISPYNPGIENPPRAMPLVGLAFVMVLALAWPAVALINLKFTPVELVQQSDQILELKLSPIADNHITGVITRMLKGKTEAKSIVIDLSRPLTKEHGEALAEALKNRNNEIPCLFFIGPPAQADPGSSNSEVEGMGYLHMDGIWVACVAEKGGTWRMTVYNDENLPKTWRGGTDMLARAVEYIMANPDAEMPSRDGVSWDDRAQFGKIEGKINACVPIDLAGDGKLTLFVACDNGDRFFAYDAASKTMKDVTSAHPTPSKSKVFAWGDFNSDGRIDLASSNGDSVGIFTQDANGHFIDGPKLKIDAENWQVVSFAAVAVGKGDKTGLIIGTGFSMFLWTPEDKEQLKNISDGEAAKDFGKAGPCIVADFDGDSIPDILQCFEKGSLICKGKSIGQFEDPRPLPLAIGGGRADAFVGDYDADGLLDLVTLSADACRIWQNNGKLHFTESLLVSGEVGYKAAGNAIAGATCDFNNDGRQDLALFYAAPMNPQFFFNRGFRSFAFASQLGDDINRSLPKDPDGQQQPQQAGCIADFNGDGAADMVVIMKNGECSFFPMIAGDNARAIRASLPLKSSFAGPLTVTGWRDKHCLGAWNVLPGSSEAFIAWPEAGPLTVKWQFPGSALQLKTINLENKVERLILAGQ